MSKCETHLMSVTQLTGTMVCEVCGEQAPPAIVAQIDQVLADLPNGAQCEILFSPDE